MYFTPNLPLQPTADKWQQSQFTYEKQIILYLYLLTCEFLYIWKCRTFGFNVYNAIALA